MLIVRFKETFRERMSEWVQAPGMIGWGLATLLSPDLFQVQPNFAPLTLFMSQPSWGAAVMLVGIVRLIFLVINGAWRPSAHIRAIGCALGAILWGALLVGSLSLGWLSPTICIYTMLLVLDAISLWFAAGDAKLADLSAKGKLTEK